MTRHLAGELANDDWDVMVLHYLGLDHIGHQAGPHSPLVGPKLEEMGRVVEQVWTGLRREEKEGRLPPAVVVVGDHGMAEGGGHGGASREEVMVPIVILGAPGLVTGGRRRQEEEEEW